MFHVKQSPPYGSEDFQRDTGVSRETLDRLKAYAELLLDWNKRKNLIGRSTEPTLWHRHMLDSAQIYPLIPKTAQSLLDIGSGAGFPGLVLAIMGVPGVHLVESDQGKAAFLGEAARVTGTPVTIHAKRLEEMAAFPADVITARALAPLTDLLALSQPFLREGGLCIFPKGQNVEVELTEAHKRWRIKTDRRSSQTDPGSTILCIGEVHRAQPNRSRTPDRPT